MSLFCLDFLCGIEAVGVLKTPEGLEGTAEARYNTCMSFGVRELIPDPTNTAAGDDKTMEVFWKLVKGELRQQLMSYAEGFNVDLMHQGDQKVKQYTNTNRVT